MKVGRSVAHRTDRKEKSFLLVLCASKLGRCEIFAATSSRSRSKEGRRVPLWPVEAKEEEKRRGKKPTRSIQSEFN